MPNQNDLEIEIIERLTARLERLEGKTRDEQEQEETRGMIAALKYKKQFPEKPKPKFLSLDIGSSTFRLFISLLLILAALVAAYFGIELSFF